MSFSVHHDAYFVRRAVSQNEEETVVQGSVTLPDRSVDIGRGLLVKAIPGSVTTDIREDRVIFEGRLAVRFLYSHFSEREVGSFRGSDVVDSGEGGTAPAEAAFHDGGPYGGEEDERHIVVDELMHAVEVDEAIPFTYVLECPGVTEDAVLETDVQVLTTSFEVKPDRMGIDVDALLRLTARVWDGQQVRLATDVSGGSEAIEVERRSLRVVHHVGEGEVTADVSGPLGFEGRVFPGEMLWVDAWPEVERVTSEDNQVSVKGSVYYRGLYVGDDRGRLEWAQWPAVHAFKLEVPVEGVTGDAVCHAVVTASCPDVQMHFAEGVPSVEANVAITARVVAEQPHQVEAVTDVHSSADDVAIKRVEAAFTEKVGEGKQVDQVAGALELPEGMPPVDRVLFGYGQGVVDDVHVLGDRVVVSGYVDVDMVYTPAGHDDGPLHTVSWPRALAFDMELPITGAEPGLERRVDVKVRQMDFDLLHRRGVEAHGAVEVSVALSRPVVLETIDDAVLIPAPEADAPTFTYVVARPGDTLWRLSAYYRSRSDLIIEANPWLSAEDDVPEPGRKVCIPRGKKS